MCQVNREKRKKTIYGRNRATKSRKNQNAREKETYKYLGILEADMRRQKMILKKRTSGELKNYIKPNYIVKISSKEYTLRLYPL